MQALKFDRQPVLIGLLLVSIIAAVYWPVTGYDFVNLDDYDYVLENPHVNGGINMRSVSWAFGSNHSGNWHPITWISHMVDAQLFGLNPGGHHITNVLLHMVNTLLLLFLLNWLTKSLWPSAVVAAWFGLHPTHVESVAWIAERKDVLSTLFFLLTLFAYAKYARSSGTSAVADPLPRRHLPRWRWYGACLLLFALGLMTKPMLVTVPCILLLLDWWPLQRFNPFSQDRKLLVRLAIEKLPFFLLSVVSSVLTVRAQKAGQAVVSFGDFPFSNRLSNALSSWLGYLEKLFWPADLAVFYPYHGYTSPGRLFLAISVLVTISVLVIRFASSRPALAVGWLWYLGTLVPVIGLIQVGGQAMADRYTYIPSIGLFLLIAWAAQGLLQFKHSATYLGVAASLSVLCLTLVSSVQVKYWKNGRILFEHARQVTTRNYVANVILGNLAAHEGQMTEAVGLFEEAIAYNADLPDAHLYLGRALERLGRFSEAADRYRHALSLRPGYVPAQIGLGSALAHLHQFPAAIEHYSKALQNKPDSWEAEAGLGLALQSDGRFEEAIPHLQRLVQLNTTNAEARFSLGIALRQTGRTNEATQRFKEALNLDPGLVKKLLDGGRALAAKGDLKAASSYFTAALELEPGMADVHQQLATFHAQQGQLDEAISHFQEALRLHPDARTHYQLGLCYALKNDPQQAINHYRQALQLQPDFPEALNDLAWLLATHSRDDLRDGKEAVRLAERACELTEHKEARFLGTLDAAYAEAGRFEQALSTARRTIELANAAGQSEVARLAQQRIAGYNAKRPYRQN